MVILLAHANIENTVRYRGVDLNDAITLSGRTEIDERTAAIEAINVTPVGPQC